MGTMGDSPRLDAIYGQGTWIKMEYVLRGTDSNITIHYYPWSLG